MTESMSRFICVLGSIVMLGLTFITGGAAAGIYACMATFIMGMAVIER